MRYKYFDLVMALFVTVLLASNIASSAKIVGWGVSLFGLPLAFDAGTLLFPISYIFGDVLTEVYGYRRSRRVIWVGFACAALMSATFWVVGKLPGETLWDPALHRQEEHIGVPVILGTEGNMLPIGRKIRP